MLLNSHILQVSGEINSTVILIVYIYVAQFLVSRIERAWYKVQTVVYFTMFLVKWEFFGMNKICYNCDNMMVIRNGMLWNNTEDDVHWGQMVKKVL